MDKFERLGKRIKELKEEKEEWKRKYNYLLEELRKLVEGNSNNIAELRTLTRNLVKKGEKDDRLLYDLRESVKNLNKSVTDLKNKHLVFKEKVSSKIDAVEKKIESSRENFEDTKEDVEKRIDEFERLLDEHKEDMGELEKRVAIEMSNMRMQRENLFEGFSKLTSDFKDLEKEAEKVKESNSNLGQRVADVERESRETKEKLETIREEFQRMVDDVRNEMKKGEKERKKELQQMMKDFLTTKSQIDEKLKILSSGMENFERLRGNMKAEIRGWISKEIAEGLNKIEESIKTSMDDLEHAKLELVKIADDLRKEVEERISSLDGKHRYFEEAVITKLKEANDNILEHLRENEERMNKALVENVEDIKKFKEEITNFVNDLVDNFEKRFELLKEGLDEVSKKVDEYKKGVSALIFE